MGETVSRTEMDLRVKRLMNGKAIGKDEVTGENLNRWGECHRLGLEIV